MLESLTILSSSRARKLEVGTPRQEVSASAEGEGDENTVWYNDILRKAGGENGGDTLFA